MTFLSLLSPAVATTTGVIAGDRLTAVQLFGAVAVVVAIVAVQRPARASGTKYPAADVSADAAVLLPSGHPQVANP